MATGERTEEALAFVGVSACICVYVCVEARKLLTGTVGCLESRESCV